MQSRKVIGRFIKYLRETKSLSLEELASKSHITYQYLSALENGKENVSIGVLEDVATAFGLNLPKLIALSFETSEISDYPKANPDFFRKIPLPGVLDEMMLKNALNETQRIIFQINRNLRGIGAKALPDYIQGNNFSGIVSNMLCDSLHDFSCFKHNSHQAYPDLLCAQKRGEPIGLEVKATTQIGKGGESHNGHAGWHLIACYKINELTRDILFVHVMLANLMSHRDPLPDWTYIGSKVNEITGSRRTETYNTNIYGNTKLRDGTIYLDPDHVQFTRWRHKRRHGDIPAHSIFATTKKSNKVF
jgi:transcriptional regulator with XRE-family HTH domain